MKPKIMIVFLLLLLAGIAAGLICGIAEDRFWQKNLPQTNSVHTEARGNR